jgi:hypothetical protein
MPIDFDKRSAAFQDQAVEFHDKTVLGWYDDVATLDAGTIRARGTAIITSWHKLAAAHAQLTAAGDREKAVLAHPQPDAAATPRGETIVGVQMDQFHADQRFEEARRQIGLVVGLQDYRGKPTLRGYHVAPTGVDPEAFVETQTHRAIHAFSIILRAGAICEKQAGLFARSEEDKLVAVISETSSEIEYKFVMAALTHLGYAAAVYSMRDDPKAQMVAHHDELQQLDAATRDGDIDPKLADRMSADVDALAGEALAITFASNDKIDRILARYEQPPEVKSVFVRMIERRGIGDSLMARGDEKRVSAFLGRPYDPKADLKAGITEGAAEITVEGLRQAPGALCSFLSGVYGGLATTLPGPFGALCKKSSEGWSSLAKVADDATGAWKDGAATRDKIAWWTGFSVEKLAEMAATRSLAETRAMTALHGATKTAEAVDMAGVAYGYVHQIQQMYDSASTTWKLAIGALPSMMTTVRTGIALAQSPDDVVFDLGVDFASAAFDTAVGAVSKKCKAKFTAEGRVAENAKKQPEKTQGTMVGDEELPREVLDAVTRLREAQERVANAKTNVDRWQHGFEVRTAAEDLRAAMKPDAIKHELGSSQLEVEEQQEERRKQNVALERGGFAGEVGDRMVEMFIDLAVGVVKKLKDVFANAIKDARKRGPDGKRRGLDTAKLEKDLVTGGATAASSAIVEAAVDKLGDWIGDKVLDKIVAEIQDWYPGTETIARAALKDQIEKLIEYAKKDVPEDWIKERVGDVVGELLGGETSATAAEGES